MLSVCILKVVTFQVVLVSNVHRTFVLINYGDIAETEQIWLVSGDGSFVVFANDRNDKELPLPRFILYILAKDGYIWNRLRT